MRLQVIALPPLIFYICKETEFNCHKLNFLNPYNFATWWCNPMINRTKDYIFNLIHSLKCQWSTTTGCKDRVIRKSSLWQELSCFVDVTWPMPRLSWECYTPVQFYQRLLFHPWKLFADGLWNFPIKTSFMYIIQILVYALNFSTK